MENKATAIASIDLGLFKPVKRPEIFSPVQSPASHLHRQETLPSMVLVFDTPGT